MEDDGEKNKQYAPDDFRREIEELTGDPENTGDFPEKINTGDLTAEDMNFWIKIKDKSITQTDLDQYIEKFSKKDPFQGNSMDYFRMFAVQRAQAIIGKKELGI
ncbi:hypothetical protein A2662_01750 [Candidatus Giovannonibacteria bacterium RIFCSPHIGHO2_01_FULL_45_33]|uniref:Uncharacterized protein n=1 Tax=Candidatus Giovannonibacteria bacterium RIFCSPLOWO2_01_FULL_45_34 TaxID=1798351 RepID=A0A1F5WYS8_9BACT|nr:MAG: hypothetical protein A2662_01750 [Candidatus Giovannonibacteria bacterium RIFCSPHIGHO2_01_FULL_45_33]OGF71010.1 MAG: hypothetical protein A3C73_04295 [Candidatus Giovannonibacteria bacterium RIFCSPHIGHO2_02_FULL_44_11]OGF80790.1 MAG: hypothetical protein A2930_01515 [Candidatus Giovannonibacteria bacterium RIFCSPLOWO2_01_FULL_45_34]